jgi:hypothetical protein
MGRNGGGKFGDDYRLQYLQSAQAMMLERPRDERREHPTAPVPLGFYLFWPVLAWVPIGLLLTPSTTEDFA